MTYMVFVQDGHAFEANENDPESLADYGSDPHTGPHCLICEGYWCQHCDPEVFKEKCREREIPTLEGLEYRQPEGRISAGRRIRL